MFRNLILIATLSTSAFSATPAAEYQANHCEFYVNSLANVHQHYGGGGYDEDILRTYISVDEPDLVADQGGKISRVGMLVKYDEHSSSDQSAMQRRDVFDWVEGKKIEPAYYRIDFTTLLIRGLSPGNRINLQRDVEFFSYFIEVERSNGELHRLWLKDANTDFTPSAVWEGFPVHTESLGSGQVKYVLEPSPIYNQKRACQ